MKHFRVIVILALRNLRRHVRRTLLTALAMVLGGGLLMFSVSLGDGTHESWIESGVRMGTGHVTIENPDFRVSRRIEDRLPADARAAAEQALRQPGIRGQVKAISAKLIVQGLASSPAGARPAQIMGVVPASEASFSTLDDHPIEGRYLEPGDRLAAYVGVGLVQSLDLRLGSRLVVTAQDTHKEIAGQLVRVVGIFRTGVPEIDQSVIHLPLDTMGEWLGTGRDVTSVGVLAERSDAVPQLTRELREALAARIASGSTTVLSWREAMPELNAAVTIDDFGNYLMNGILFIIIGFGIVNTVLMSVMYRHREFGVLQALGFTPGQTGVLVLFEGLLLTAASAIVGVGLGLFVTWYFWRDGLDFSRLYSSEMTFSGVVINPVIIPLFRAARIVQALGFILFIGALASVYPAVRATKIDVTEAMKFER
jgi:ABC-type lipoprotein release transport system permease subunit